MKVFFAAKARSKNDPKVKKSIEGRWHKKCFQLVAKGLCRQLGV
jgi:hypothetical protein